MLSISNLAISYGGIAALRGVNMTVRKGGFVALIGPNGAGKTTLLNGVSGVVPAQSGAVALDGEALTGRPAHRIARQGFIHVPEGRQVLGPMTVEENLDLGRHAAGARAPGDVETVYALFPILKERRGQLSGSLSGGQQQMLAIGRALMGAPRLLALDEPSLGLSPLVATQVFAALTRLNREGLTIFLVEQNARRALAAADYAYVLEGGRVVREGPSGDLANDPAIVAHYLGHA